jgi:trk system potassium uptake protein TrkH
MEMYSWLLIKGIKRQRVNFVFSLNFKVVTSTTIFLLIFGVIGFFLTELANPETFGTLTWQEKILAAWFQSVTTRTAGFNTVDLGVMTTAGLFITIAFMFVGASPSGTGGGTKTTTLRVLTNATRSILQGKQEVQLYEREVPYSLILKATGVFFGSAMMIVIGTTLISFTDTQFTFIQILFEVVSAFATVGLSTGITAGVSAFGKCVLICMMYIGRVSVLIFMTALLGETPPSNVKYPEENLLVG